MIWKHKPNLDFLNNLTLNTLVQNLGIQFVEVGDDYIKASMPVDHRTVQPMRLLHGGASVALAETLGSVASVACVDDITKQAVVGVEINANHLRAVKSGSVIGTVKPVKIGRTIHVWNIEICNEEGKICCTSRITTMIINT